MRFGEVLTTLTGLNPARWIDFKVPQGLAEIRVGDNVKVNDISGGAVGVAQVIAVSDAFAEGTRTYDVRARSAFDAETWLMVQVFAIRTGPTENLMSVPAAQRALGSLRGHTFVIVDAEAGAYLPHRASLRRVEVRGETADRFYIRGELNPGDRIAIKVPSS